MPIELPNLDDRRFADLVEEGKRLISGFAPSWTDHNPSDPGITFIELFASVAEMLMYRINRISEPNKRAFLQLLAPDRKPTPGWTVDQELSAAILDLRREERAVTAADFETLALQVPGVARAHCLPRRNLQSGAPNAALTEVLGHVSLLVVCAVGHDAAFVNGEVRKHLQGRSLLTTRVHVVQPATLTLAVTLTLRAQSGQLKQVVEQRAWAALEAFFDPLSGGRDQQGCQIGARIYRSDLYALMDEVEGVDYVEISASTDDLFVVSAPGGDRKIGQGASYVGLALLPNELAVLSRAASAVVIEDARDITPR